MRAAIQVSKSSGRTLIDLAPGPTRRDGMAPELIRARVAVGPKPSRV